MKILSSRLAGPALLLLGLSFHVTARADLHQDLGFTAFSGTVVDINALAAGQVMQARGPLLDFQRGITAQALYVLDAAPLDVEHKLITWNPASHPELKVWAHHPLPARPALADFATLASLPDNSSTGYLFTATANLDPENPAVQIDKSEAQMITPLKASNPDSKALFAQFWGQVLNGRIDNFLNGHLATAKYYVASGDIPVQGDIISLLRGDPKVYRDFHPLLANSPLYAMTKVQPTALYFDCFDVEGYGSLGTGAVFQAASGSAYQSADIEYYCNSGIYTTIELEKVFPLAVNGKPESLVWREDLVSTANVAYLHGMERLASSMLMLQDVKQGIDAFRAEFK